ncbi:MAG TPA: BON domain-containing protein [Thermoanaerobaculia bacterium]|nr:BON domain-containing protein [Thermoanaerobaculia bacterium]
MNTKIRMSVLLAASLLAACAGTVPASRSAAGPDEDRDVAEAGLAADVRLALLDKLGWDALDVKVDVDGGQASLTGEVDKRTTQELAEEVALSVQGVERVDNRLRLKPQSAPETRVDHAVSNTEREVNDAALEMRVGKNLLAEIGRYALGLEVEVTDGVASVRGTVPDRERKSLALKAAERTSGVKKVIDLIEVRGR